MSMVAPAFASGGLISNTAIYYGLGSKLGLLKATGYGITGLNLGFTANELYKGQTGELLPVVQQIYELSPSLYDGVRLLSGYASYNIAMLGMQNYSNYKYQQKQQNLLSELRNSGNKFNENDIKFITKTKDGKLVWLETGNSTGSRPAGYEHIRSAHSSEFMQKGISSEQIPSYLNKALSTGNIVGMQGTRPIYEFQYNGSTHRVAITVGSNGYIVGANPK